MRAAPTFQEPGTLDSWVYAGGGAAATDIIGASGTAEGRSTYETQHSASESAHGA